MSNIQEYIKSKLDKSYILNSNSPQSLKKNKELVLRTVKKNAYYIDEIEQSLFDDPIFRQQIVDIAIQNGYKLSKNSPLFLKENKDLIKLSIEDPITAYSIYDLELSVAEDKKFINELVKISSKDERHFDRFSSANELPQYLKTNEEYILKRYELMIQNGQGINSLLISKDLISNNPEFIADFINLLNNNGINFSIDSLLETEELKNEIKNNPNCIETLLKNTPKKVGETLNKLFTKEEQKAFMNKENLPSSLSELAALYKEEPNIINTASFELFEKPLSNLNEYTKYLFASYEKGQEELLEMPLDKRELFVMLSNYASNSVGDSNRIIHGIFKNMNNENYAELINEFRTSITNAENVLSDDIARLASLLSSYSFDETATETKNSFNITSIQELRNYDNIKNGACDYIISDQSLTSLNTHPEIQKYVEKFLSLNNLDRLKNAFLEKHFCLSLEYAKKINEKYGSNIENMPDNYAINQVKLVKSIVETSTAEDLRTLMNIPIPQSSLIDSMLLEEQVKDAFRDEYLKELTSIDEKDKIGSTLYNDKNIDIYEKEDMNLITKYIRKHSSKELWNSNLTDEGLLRYETCCSYSTNENLPYRCGETMVMVGFNTNIKNYSLDSVYESDVHSTMSDGIYVDYDNAKYMSPEDLNIQTDDNYNEVNFKTITLDSNGKLTHLQPDFVIYIKEKTDTSLSELESDEIWTATRDIAIEFDIPIVIFDKEKIKNKEILSIKEMSELNNDKIALSSKISHYIARYGQEEINKIISKEKQEEIKQEAKKEKEKPKKTIGLNEYKTIVEKQWEIKKHQPQKTKEEIVNTMLQKLAQGIDVLGENQNQQEVSNGKQMGFTAIWLLGLVTGIVSAGILILGAVLLK